MNPKTRTKLRFGPYRTPRFQYGDVVFCERAGEVTLCGLSSGRIPWPMCRCGKAKAIALVGDLVEAVRRESAVAVQYWWGVGDFTVWQWRKALGVGSHTEGTRALRRAYGKEKKKDGRLAMAWAKAGDPERRAKIAAAKRGKPRPPHLMKALHEGNRGRKRTLESRRKMSAAQKRRGAMPPNGKPWSTEEDTLIRTLPAHEAAERTRRTIHSVYARRHQLKLPDGRQNKMRKTKIPLEE